MTALHAAEAATADASVHVDDHGEPAVPRSWWGLALALLGGIMGAGALSDNSFLTHLATGRIIVADGVPDVDPYSFTASGEPWVVSSWLASWMYAAAETAAGLAGVRLLVAGATALTVGLVWRVTAPARGVLVRVGLVAVVVVLSGGWFSERPQIFAFAAAAAVMVVLRERRSPWWLVPVGLVWVNVHASWPLGLVLIGLWAGAYLLDERSVDRHGLECAAVFGGAIFLGAVMSPVGPQLLSFPVEMLDRVDTLQFIKEWRRPSPTDPDLWIFLGGALGTAVLAVRRRRMGTALAALALVAPVAMGMRNIPVAAMMLVTLAAPFLAGYGDERIGPVPSRRQLGTVGSLGGIAIMALVMATPNLDLGPYPVEILDELEDSSGSDLADHRILTLDYVGNYLEFRDGPEANVWHDDRAEVIPHEVFADYVALLSDDVAAGEWADTVGRYDVDVIVWPADETFGRWVADGGLDSLASGAAPEVGSCADGRLIWTVSPNEGAWVVATRGCASEGA